jgi:hypothetical protein
MQADKNNYSTRWLANVPAFGLYILDLPLCIFVLAQAQVQA